LIEDWLPIHQSITQSPDYPITRYRRRIPSERAHPVHAIEPDDGAHQELLDALPDVRAAKLVQATVIREPRATFSLAPGQPARPSTETGVRGFLLAGDWIDTGLPATIESAVRSGNRAADRCIPNS